MGDGVLFITDMCYREVGAYLKLIKNLVQFFKSAKVGISSIDDSKNSSPENREAAKKLILFN